MKTILLTFCLIVTGCANNADQRWLALGSVSAPDVVPVQTCNVIDTCTNDLSQLGYQCKATTYVQAEHPEIPLASFDNASCLTTKEDYHLVPSLVCDTTWTPCRDLVQGPGPKAIDDEAP